MVSPPQTQINLTSNQDYVGVINDPVQASQQRAKQICNVGERKDVKWCAIEMLQHPKEIYKQIF